MRSTPTLALAYYMMLPLVLTLSYYKDSFYLLTSLEVDLVGVGFVEKIFHRIGVNFVGVYFMA